MAIYFDSSGLVKRYDPNESGSAAVVTLLNSSQRIFTSALTQIEVISAFRLKERGKAFSAADVLQAVAVFEAHLKTQYDLIASNTDTYTDAKRSLLTYKLRAYDAMQIATALTIARVAKIPIAQIEFYTSDSDQAVAAKAEGLTVVLI